MRYLRILVLYACTALGANTALADSSGLIALAEGDLAKLQFSSAPEPVPVSAFLDANGGEQTMESYRGKYVVLNFWAMWCAPCREEMPALDALDAELGGADFEVVTVATGRNLRGAVDKFFVDAQLDNLPKLFDPKMTMAQEFRVRGLPVTVLIDPEGREVARASGAVHWDSPAALRLFRAWMASS